MKYLLIISCLLLTTVGWSKDVSYDDLLKREGLYYEKFTDVPYTGEASGKKSGKILKGIKDGNWLEYWDNGQLKYKENWKDGKKDGEFLEYHENGFEI